MSMKEEEKTVIISETPKNILKTTTSTNKHEHLSVIKLWNKRILVGLLLFLTILFICAAAFLIYNHEIQMRLTNTLKHVVQTHDLAQGEEALSQIKAHGYKSDQISLLEKEFMRLKEEENAWKKAQNYYNLGMYKEATTILQTFTSNAEYKDRAILELNTIKEKAVKQKIGYATQLYIAGQLRDAQLLIQEVLAIDPLNTDANALLSTIKSYVLENKKIKHNIQSQSIVENPGDLAYKNGDIDKAILLWQQKNEKDDTKKVIVATNIKRYMNTGERALASLNYETAITSFNKVAKFMALLKLHNTILENAIKKNLSISYSFLGMEALKDGMYIQANNYFQKSFSYDPANEEVIKGFNILNQEADALYKKAYIISNANHAEACKLYKQALDIAGKDTDVYKKIKQHFSACQ